jgi:chromate transporter
MVWIFLLSGIITNIFRSPLKFHKKLTFAFLPSWLTTGLMVQTSHENLWKMTLYFAKAGAFVFGSGLAIVPFLHSGVVTEYGWLTERQFIDAVAVAMITPGPVVITVAFIGYLVSGPLGACLASLATFLPCYLFTVGPAPYFRTFAKNKKIKDFVDGVTAAAVGAIAGAAMILGRKAIFDIPTATIALVTLIILIKFKKLPEPLIIMMAGMVGIMMKMI